MGIEQPGWPSVRDRQLCVYRFFLVFQPVSSRRVVCEASLCTFGGLSKETTGEWKKTGESTGSSVVGLLQAQKDGGSAPSCRQPSADDDKDRVSDSSARCVAWARVLVASSHPVFNADLDTHGERSE